MSAYKPVGQDDRKVATTLGYLSGIATAVLILCLATLALSFLWYNRQAKSEALYVQFAERQIGATERLGRMALIISESRRPSRMRGLAVTTKFGEKLMSRFSTEFGEWQAREKSLQLGDSKIGLATPSSLVFGKSFDEAETYYSRLVKDFAFVRDEAAAGATPKMRTVLAETTKLIDPFTDTLRDTVSIMQDEGKKRNKTFTMIAIGCGIPVFISIIFIFFVMTKGNLAHLNRVIVELESTQSQLTDSLSEAQTALSLSNMASRRFEQLFAGLPIGCFTCDAHGVIYEWNHAAEQLTGYDSFEVYMKSVFETVYTAGDRDLLKGYLATVLEGHEITGVEIEETRKDGTSYSAMVNLLPMKGANGQYTSVIVANADITALKMRERELAESREQLRVLNGKLTALATTDGLTGLFNHRAFQESFDRAYRLAKEDGLPLSIALLDVDRFKQFNDAFGHPAGDAVLKQVASLLKGTCKEPLYVARYGGEEFVIVLPGADEETAIQLVELARLAIERAVWPNREVTASFGIATLHSGTTQPSELISNADQALYASKAAGRNRVTHFNNVESQAA